jgi:S-DNA-T family DNA segregation ATPase FtsK/SpoIIIE
LSSKRKNTGNPLIEEEPIRKEIKGIIFLLFSIILGVSLFTYHHDDPLLLIKTGDFNEVHNLFGVIGSHISGYLFHIIGFSSFWLVVIFFIMAVLSFKGSSLLPPLKNIIAILFLLVSFSGIMSLQLGGIIEYRGGDLYSGGLVGEIISKTLTEYLNIFGTNVLLFTIFIISLMICTHISFGWIFSKIYLYFILLFRRIREYCTKKLEKRKKSRTRFLKVRKREKGQR